MRARRGVGSSIRVGGTAFVSSASARRHSRAVNLCLSTAVRCEFNALAGGLVRLGCRPLEKEGKAMITR